MEHSKLETQALLRIKDVLEKEIHNSGWHWNPFFSSLLDQVQSRVTELQEQQNHSEIKRRKLLLKTQAAYLELGQWLEKLSNE